MIRKILSAKEIKQPDRKCLLVFGGILGILIIAGLILVISLKIKANHDEDQSAKQQVLGAVSSSVFLEATGINAVWTNSYNEPQSFNSTINTVSSIQGAYILDNNNFTGTEDRYEVVFNSVIDDIYGLGMYEEANSVALSDFSDLDFAAGHFSLIPAKYQADVARMKTPIFVLPKNNLIIAYLHPGVKKITLSRQGGKTKLVLKKNETFTDEPVGRLLVIKGNSIEDAYAKYYQSLKTLGFWFKKPHYNAFGLYWETYNEFGCRPTLAGVKNIINKYRAKNIAPTAFVVGSGYWPDNPADPGCIPGCGDQCLPYPTTDAFKVSPERFVSATALDTFFNEMTSLGIYPLIGMRHNVHNDTSHLAYLTSLFGSAYIFMGSQVYLGESPSNNVRYFNLNNLYTTKKHLDMIFARYGSIKGIKEDEMIFGNQKRLADEGMYRANFMADIIPKAYKAYSDKTGNDFIIFGRNDYFGVGTDGQNSQGYLTTKPGTEYAIKYLIDSSFSQIFSGYPHPVVEAHLVPCSAWPFTGSEKETLRTLQLATFLPVTDHSCDYTRLANTRYVKAIDYFAALRLRLQKYAYDQAMKWYQSGVPHLARPLSIDNRFVNDSNVYSQYRVLDSTSNTNPRNEYMFGNALLIRPVYNATDSVTVYLPAGVWKPLLKDSPQVTGGKNVTYSLGDEYDFPVYFRQGEILILADTADRNILKAYTYLGDQQSSAIYKYYTVNNNSEVTNYVQLRAENIGGNIYLKNLNNGCISKMLPPATYDKGFLAADVSSVFSPCSATVPTPKITNTPTPTPSFTPTPIQTPTPKPTPSLACYGPDTRVANDDFRLVLLKFTESVIQTAKDIKNDLKYNVFELATIIKYWDQTCYLSD